MPSIPATTTMTSGTPSSTSPSSVSSSSHLQVVLGTTLGVLGALTIVGIVYAILRLRRKREEGVEETGYSASRGSRMLDPSHPASKITPFGSQGGEMPRYSFAHTPGANMRIAHRGMDGAWRFTDPDTPLTSSNHSDLDLVPPRSRLSSVTSTSSRTHRSKENEGRVKGTKLGYLEMEQFEVVPPPPAYTDERQG